MAELTLAEAVAARDALLRKMMTGEESVGYQDKRVTYRPSSGMRDALALADATVVRLGGTSILSRSRQVLMVTKDDW